MAKLVHVISVGTDDAYRVVMKDIHINPEHVVTPGIFVNGVVEIADPQQEEVLIRAGVAYA